MSIVRLDTLAVRSLVQSSLESAEGVGMSSEVRSLNTICSRSNGGS